MRDSEHEWEYLPFLPCDPTIDGSENNLRHRFSTILFWSVRSHLTWLEIYNLKGHFFS
jgi:hypothetical protein